MTRKNGVFNGTVRVYMGENTQEMLQGKAYQQYLENTENKAELIDWFTQYIQQDHVRSKLKGNVIFNSRDVTYKINSSQLKTLLSLTMKRLTQRKSIAAAILTNHA